MDLINSEIVEVAIVKGETPKETVLNGIDKLGGISKYINDGDQVFVKFNLYVPNILPSHIFPSISSHIENMVLLLISSL